MALALGEPNVDRLLAGLSYRQFTEWKVFHALDPFGEAREDQRNAAIVQALWNIARDPKQHPDGWPLRDFVLHFGDSLTSYAPPVRTQPVDYQEHVIDAWTKVANVIDAQERFK